MRPLKNFILLIIFSAVAVTAKAQDKNVYLFSFKHFKTSFGHEILVSPLMHHARSGHVANYYTSGGSVLNPSPVYNRVYGFFTMTYQPRFRLIEVGKSFTVALRTPLTMSLSTVDLRTKESNRYSPPTITQFDPTTARYSNSRISALGTFHAESGALIGIDLGRGATVENTAKRGLSIAAGVNMIYAPLNMNEYLSSTRADYKGLLSWASPVAQIGLLGSGVSLYYTFGIRPVRVHYYNNRSEEVTVLTNTYQRVSIGFKLGK